MSEPNDKKSWMDVDPEVRRFISPALFHWPHLAYEHQHEACIMFVDVAGFTALSESLMSYGPEGAEILDRTIAEYFDGLLDIVDHHGGVPLKISGDALTLLFLGDDNPFAETAKRATACAAELAHYTPQDSRAAALDHKVGLGSGRLITGMVGDAELRKEFVYNGPALLDAVHAEHEATAGEVWISQSTAQFLGDLGDEVLAPPRTIGGARRLKNGARGTLRQQVGASVAAYSLPEFQQGSEFLPLVPKTVVAHAKGSTLEYLCRHQIISVLFSGCPELTLESPEDIPTLDRHYRAMAAIIDKHGGFLSEYEGGDKGSKLIIFFGAPMVLEEPARNAARCAWAMQDQARRMGTVTNQRIGLSTGRLYVGRIGCRSLVKYSALGDRMNLAARLMGLAQAWEVIAESSSVEKSSSAALWSPSKTVQVKGKTQLITINQLIGLREVSRENRRGVGLVGRKKEKALAEAGLKGLENKVGSLLDVIGGPGMGKTRLAMAIWRSANLQKNVTSFLWRGQEAERSTGPLAPWLPILSHIMKIPLNGSLEERQKAFDSWLGSQSLNFQGQATLLAPLLDVHGTLSELHAGLKDELRVKLQRQALTDVILSDSNSAKVMIVEQGEQLDSQTQESFIELAPLLNQVPFMLVILRRPAIDKDPLLALRDEPCYQSVELPALQQGECDSLAMNRLKVSQLDSELSSLLYARSQGNPLQLEAWIDALRDTNRIAVKFGTAILQGADANDLPDRLEALILTRLERLPPDAQTTLRIASVCQQAFTPDDILELHPKKLQIKTVESHLALGARAGLLYYDRDRRPWMYFSRAEFREALHSSLPYQIRRRHHSKRIEGLLKKAQSPLTETTTLLLAQHYKHVPDRIKQGKYFTLAYEIFERRYESRQVLLWATQALDVATKLEQIEERCRCLKAIITALTNLGENEARLSKLQQLKDLAEIGQLPAHQVDALCMLGSLHARKGEPEKATAFLEQAKAAAYAANDSGLILDTCNTAATIYGELGHGQKCREAAEEAIEQMDPSILNQKYVYAMANRGFAATLLGSPQEALDAFTLALEGLEKLDDTWNQSLILGNIGIEMWGLGHPEEGHKRLLKALELNTKMGVRREMALNMLNVGFSHYRLGDVEQAIACTEDAIQVFQRQGYHRGLRICKQNLAEMAWISGHAEEAIQYLDEIEAQLGDKSNTVAATDIHLLRGEIHLDHGDYQLARGCFSQACKLTKDSKSTKELNALEGLGIASHFCNKIEQGFLYLEQATKNLETQGLSLDYPQRLWWRASKAAQAMGKTALAQAWSKKAYDLLLEFLNQIHEPSTRSRVINTFRWNQQIWEHYNPKATDSLLAQ